MFLLRQINPDAYGARRTQGKIDLLPVLRRRSWRSARMEFTCATTGSPISAIHASGTPATRQRRGDEMTYCPCCGRPYLEPDSQARPPAFWVPPTFWPAPLSPTRDTTSAGWTHLWLSQQQNPLESPQESYSRYVRGGRETEAALARYPSGWREPASEWNKIP